VISPSLIITSPLFEGVASEDVTAENVFKLRSTPIAGYEADPPFHMIRSDGEARPVRTINDLKAAEEDGCLARSNADLVVLNYFKRIKDVLAAIYVARNSRVSFLQHISAVELLPARLVPFDVNLENSNESPLMPPDVTIAKVVADGRCKVDVISPHQIFVEGTIRTTLTEVMRGDLNGDGIEDVLVWQFHRVSGGSMHWSETVALTRTSESSLFSRVDLPFQ